MQCRSSNYNGEEESLIVVRFRVVSFISGVLLNPLGNYGLRGKLANVNGRSFHENSHYRTLAVVLLQYIKTSLLWHCTKLFLA